MSEMTFPVIDLVATGNNIRRLRVERGLSVKDLQRFFGFEEPRAVYKWQKGETLPSVDNLFALGMLLGVPMESILVQRQSHIPAYKEQQEESCCSHFMSWIGAVGFCGVIGCEATSLNAVTKKDSHQEIRRLQFPDRLGKPSIMIASDLPTRLFRVRQAWSQLQPIRSHRTPRNGLRFGLSLHQ